MFGLTLGRSNGPMTDLEVQMVLDALPVPIVCCNVDNRLVTFANKQAKSSIEKLSKSGSSVASDLVGAPVEQCFPGIDLSGTLLAATSVSSKDFVVQGDGDLFHFRAERLPRSKGAAQAILSWTNVSLHKGAIDPKLMAGMLDQMPVNVMLADAESLEICYVNETSRKTLKAIEHLMPVKADDVLGANIDIFHKNPSHQRSMLGTDRHLPHRAKIRLGDEVLDLRVSALYDENRHYSHVLVCWSVATDTVRLADGFESNVKGIVDTVASASTELSSTSETMAAAAEETNVQSQTVASAAEQLAASIEAITQQVANTTIAVDRAVVGAKESSDRISSLQRKAEEIGSVIGTINKIAAQTNLLALNATIEAARAGEVGKGFAVVANEVKSLSTQTAQATEEISREISAIQEETRLSVSSISNIIELIQDIAQMADVIAGAVEQQNAATQEVTANISGVTEASSETGAAAHQTQSAASELSRQAEELARRVDEFLENMRNL